MTAVSPTPEQVRVRAPGKINLGLAVGRRRLDGYHPLVNVFQAVSVHDDVVARAADGITVTVSGRHADRVPEDGTNLAARAATLLAAATGVTDGVALHVHKQIPVAGGMAGGSADAAATLLACDTLWRTGLGREQMLELAADLGSDVPFALVGHTAVGRGRGDLLSPVMGRGEYHWALAVRDAGLSTPAVYRVFDDLIAGSVPEEPEVDHDLMRALRAGNPADLGRALSNDLQPAALELAPELAETLAVAEDAGALGVLVSGSGPTVAALGRDAAHVRDLAAALTAAGVAEDVITASGPVPGARVLAGEPVGAGQDRG